MPRPFLDFMTDEMIDALARDIDEYEHDLSRDVPRQTFDPSTESRSTPQVTPKSGDSSASSAIGC